MWKEAYRKYEIILKMRFYVRVSSIFIVDVLLLSSHSFSFYDFNIITFSVGSAVFVCVADWLVFSKDSLHI